MYKKQWIMAGAGRYWNTYDKIHRRVKETRNLLWDKLLNALSDNQKGKKKGNLNRHGY